MYHEGWKSFWAHLMEHLGDVGHVKSCISPFGNSVSVGVMCMVCAKTHPMILLGDEAQVKAHFGLFRDSANLVAR
jgi:hypothetical protein